MRVEFRRLDVIVARPGSPPVENASIIICWEIVQIHTGLDQAIFVVERSLSPSFPTGDTEVISGVIAGVPGQAVYFYEDITPSLISLWRRYFYRVRATYAPDTSVSEGKTWEKTPKIYELAIIERHDFVLHYIQGWPSFAFIERTASVAPCSECFDPTAGRVTKSNCKTCLGTGKQRPYFEPIPCWMDFNPGENIVQIASLGELHINQKTCWWSAYPVLKNRDIIYQCGTSSLFRVVKIGPNSEPQGVTVMQVASLEEVEHKDILYTDLPRQIAPDRLMTIMQEWDEIRQQRMF